MKNIAIEIGFAINSMKGHTCLRLNTNMWMYFYKKLSDGIETNIHDSIKIPIYNRIRTAINRRDIKKYIK